MLRINQLKLRPDHSEYDMEQAIRKQLKVSDKLQYTYHIVKRSIDSRHKPDIFFVYSVNIQFKSTDDERSILKKVKNNNIMLLEEKKYSFFTLNVNAKHKSQETQQVIVGCGPAGLFCGLFLARAGLKPIIIERGLDVDTRKNDVESFWKGGELKLNSNVQFGEGGAGTFSDGKLNTMVKDPFGRIEKVLETFVEFGADSSIKYINKPHIGTDVLSEVIKNIRNEIIRLGGVVKFNTRLIDIRYENSRITSIDVLNALGKEENIKCNEIVLAIGHSSRDTFEMLNNIGINMVSKAFAVGLRIEHPQELINYNAYGNTIYKNLPVADYKVTYQADNNRGVYSFCMCPGGYVVNASSEKEMIAVNGMSYSKRDGDNANSALIVTVHPQDFENNASPLSGVEFQRRLEKAAYIEGNGNIPIQLVADFKQNVKSVGLGQIKPSIKGKYQFANIRNIMPEFINSAIIQSMSVFNNVIKGFDMDEAVFSGVESRTSSPVRILRDETMQSNIKGVYPCGEGAGYAGGITSAAIDGIKIAEKIIEKYNQNI